MKSNAKLYYAVFFPMLLPIDSYNVVRRPSKK